MSTSYSELVASATPTSTARSPWRRLLRRPVAVVALALVAFTLLIAVIAPLLAPYGANDTDLASSLLPPGPEHWLGADRAGRDLFSRLLLATPVSVSGMLLTLTVALVIGIPAGLIAGDHARRTAVAANWGADLVMAMPAIIILLALRASLGPSIWVSMTAFGVLLSPVVYRVVETTVRNSRSELYLDAARVNGLSHFAIVRRHLSRVIAAPLVIQSAFIAGIAIGMQAALEFIGVGDSSVPTWGGMLDLAFKEVYSNPLQILWPMLAIALLSASLIVIATSLADVQRVNADVATRRPNAGFARVPDRTAESAVAAPDEAVLSIRGLQVAYPSARSMRTVVHGVDLDIRRGEITGLVGESGSGKTQVALSVLGLLPGSAVIPAGEIFIDGRPLSTMSSAARRALLRGTVGYVPQEPMSNLDPSFTVGGQTARPLRVLHGMSRAQARRRVIELFESVGIADPERVYRAYPHEISGGMAQRILIAGALLSEPELLVADEATTALDVTVQAEVLELLRSLNRDRGMAILLVTHNLGVVSDLCHSVAVMREGRIVEKGTTSQVLRHPEHEYTRTLIDSILTDRPPRITHESETETTR